MFTENYESVTFNHCYCYHYRYCPILTVTVIVNCHTAKTLRDKLQSNVGGTLVKDNSKTICRQLSLLKQTNRKKIINFSSGVALLWTRKKFGQPLGGYRQFHWLMA